MKNSLLLIFFSSWLLSSCQEFPNNRNVFSEITSAGNAAIHYFDALEQRVILLQNNHVPNTNGFNENFSRSLVDKEAQLKILNSLEKTDKNKAVIEKSIEYLTFSIACINDEKLKAFITMSEQNELNIVADSLTHYKSYLSAIFNKESSKYKALDTEILKFQKTKNRNLF